MSTSGPFARVYWSVMEDPKFDGIREDVRHLGTWTLMLVIAEMAWPAPAFIPQLAPKASVAALTTAGIVDRLSGGRYRIHGLDGERERRAAVGRKGGLASGVVRGSSNDDGTNDERSLTEAETIVDHAHARITPVAEQSIEENRKAETSNAPDAAVSYNVRTGRYPSSGILKWLTDIARKAGAGDELAGEARVAALIDRTPYTGTPKEYLELIDDTLRREDHEATALELREEAERIAAKRAKPPPLRAMPVEQTEEEAAAELAAYYAAEGIKP